MNAFKKSALVIALAAAAAGAQAAEVYGTVDVGVNYIEVNGAAVTGVESGQSADSFIGVKAAEDLGGGLKVGVTLEAGVAVDQGATSVGKLFDREASIAVTSGAHAVKLGRLETPTRAALKQYDAFGGGTFGVARAVTDTTGDYVDNAVAYSFGAKGLKVGVAHIFGEQIDGGVDEGSATIVQVGYAYGPASASLTHTKIDAGSTTTLVGADYDFGVAKASLMYQDAKDSGLDNSVLVGVKAPVHGNMAVMASLGQAKLATGDKIDLFAVGGEYNLSKRTNLYAAYGKLDGLTAEQLSLGLKHKF